MKRVFLAIRFKDNEFMSQYINEIKKRLLAENIKWVEEKNLHLTLKYIGPTENRQLERVKTILDSVFRLQKSIQINFHSLGIFGSKYQPRVLWMGMEQIEEIQSLEKQISLELEKIGIDGDNQNFIPHLTIGRIKQLQSKKYFQSVVDQFKSFKSGVILIDRVYLYQSIMLKEGPEYRVLQEYVLKNKPI